MKNWLLLLILITTAATAQFSKTHYIPPLSCSQNMVPEDQYLYISTPSTTPVNFRIINLGGLTEEGTVTRDNPFIYYIGFGLSTQLFTDRTEIASAVPNRGFIVEAEDLIYVTARVIAGNSNQAGMLVSKGLAALGTQFRIGAMLNTLTQGYQNIHHTFISILATENNTTVSFSDIIAPVQLINDNAGNNPGQIILNSGESYVMAVEGPLNANRDGLIGALVSSDKPIAVNCGSFGGTNGGMNNIDTGFDQIVSVERTGTDYIFIRSTGTDDVERVLIVAHEDDTQVFFNGNTTPAVVLFAGQYMTFSGGDFDMNGNLYVRTSKKVFAYQSIGDDGRPDQANQEMFFVPPLSCETPRIIDNIPDLDLVGDRQFTGRVSIVTQSGAALSFVVDGTSYDLATLPGSVTVQGPNNVMGNPDYQTYVITGLSGDVSVISTGQLYLASYGSSIAATFGGFYSGFTFKPEVAFDKIDLAQANCIPNITLSVSPITAFDVFQWYFNDEPIAGASGRTFIPTVPGYYHVSATISACGTTLISDKIPVSSCPADSDNDGSNDNVDFDFDQDGITNCDESFGSQPFNLSDPLAGTVSVATYSNSFTGSYPEGTGVQAAVPFQGTADGNFTSSVTAGKGNIMRYNMVFDQPLRMAVTYATDGPAGGEMTSESEFVISVPASRTISVLNPDGQLLIDTNYDGIYESGVTEFSSFEIRFRLESGVLPYGTGTFSFQSNDAASLSYTHKNLTDNSGQQASFMVVALCVAKDSDGDGVPDQIDLDSDNDSIPDTIEAQGLSVQASSGTDTDANGIDDAFGNGILADTDGDGIPNHLDLDSDNDGIFDIVESASGATDANQDGIADGAPGQFGANGLLNNIEAAGSINYTVLDTDADGILNYVDTDSDADDCSDVLEAGFTDANNDGQLGSNASANASGIITGAGGYTAPNPLYLVPTPIVIAEQPADNSGCEARPATFTVDAGTDVSYQWQISTDGVTFSNLSNGTVYSGVTSSTMTIANVTAAMDGDLFRVLISRAGNICGATSDVATLSVSANPISVVTTLVQCDLGLNPDGLTVFNLEQATSTFTQNAAGLEVAYYLSAADAESETNALPLIFSNTSNPQQLVVRTTNSSTGCFNISTLNLQVNLLPNIVINLPEQCDTDGTEDGIFAFDLTSAGIPGSASAIRYFANADDALLETNPIANPTAYQNATPYVAQTVYARVENGNNCARLYQINLKVNPLPDVDPNLDLEPHLVCVNTPTFSTVIDAGLNPGADPSQYSYQWYFVNTPIPGATAPTLPVNVEGDYKVVVTDGNGCSRTRFVPVVVGSPAIIASIEIVDLSEPNTITVNLTSNSYGDYVYTLDYPNAWQTSNFFANVPMGNHIVYVKDLNGCPITSQIVSVLGIPAYFTPNGDGYNDTWNVKGVGPSSQAGLTVKIFDRYGKFLKQIGALGEGWDGTYNGRNLPSDDYWYLIIFEDSTQMKGHFTLKR